MAENTQRSRGRPQSYKFDRGGTAAEMGPYIGIVVNNVDSVRSGRLQVYIEEFGATNANGTPNLTDPTLWRTVSYCPPFYGATPVSGTSAGVGTYPGNRNSYGMWFTPPDLGVKVICFFVNGDPSQGYYLGCIPEDGINHMIPAIGASTKYVPGNQSQAQAFSNSPLMPVTEINVLNEAINENPRFYDQPKPVQGVVAGILFQQGLNKDPIRGPIRSNSQRESPSSVYGISTPGKAIYQGGLDPKTIRAKLEKGEVTPQDIAVIGRQGGHTFVMDDGDLEGTDTLIRIRTAKGHQITMSDDGDCFYITHANGQTWLEFGKQGTVDVYSTNSINLRTEGTLNLHADKNINMYAGGNIKMKAKNVLALESAKTITLNAESKLVMFSKAEVSVRSDGKLALKSKTGSWAGGSSLNLKGSVINLNGAPTLPAASVPNMPIYKLVDTEFTKPQGWTPVPGSLETIVTRAPTHEPYPYHNKGVNNKVDLNQPATIEDTSTDTTSSTQTPAQGRRSDAAVEEANGTAVKNPVSAEDVVAEPSSAEGVGNVSGEDVQAMTAQQAKQTSANVAEIVGTPYDDDGNLNPGWVLDGDENPYYAGEKLSQVGIGKYGQTAQGLVQTGFLKPGALDLITSPSMYSTVLNSPNVWTGQSGITDLLGYLASPILQNLTQIALISSAFRGLLDRGVLAGDESARYQATFIQPATQYGVDYVEAWTNNTLEDTAIRESVVILARQGQYAVDFVETYGQALDLAADVPGYTNTVERQDLDQAVTDIIGNEKIPPIEYVDAPIVTTVADVIVPPRPDEDSTFRFAPGKPKD